MAKKSDLKDMDREALIEEGERIGTDWSKLPVSLEDASHEQLVERVHKRRVANERRRRYKNDPEFRERVKQNNQNYQERKKDAEPDEEEAFDDLLETYRSKWESEADEEGSGEVWVPPGLRDD